MVAVITLIKVLVAKHSDLKERFTFTVKNKRWAKVADIIGGPQGYSFKLTDSWTNLIRKYFHRHNGYCPIAFKYHKVHPQSKHHYFSATARCKHEKCYTFKFTANRMPRKGQDFVINVESEGSFMHERGVFRAEFIRADERRKLKKILVTKKAAGVATKIFKEGNLDQIKAGNITSMPARETIQRIRHEANKDTDYAIDPLLDICKRMEEESIGENLPRYIQTISYSPFAVVLFMDLQLRALQELLKCTRDIVGHLDATGSLIRPLIELETGPIYVYSLVIENPMRNGPPLALLEFIDKQHDSDSIAVSLKWFLKKAHRYLDLTPQQTIFSRIETDFSLALLGSVLQAFLHINMPIYLNQCWQILFHSWHRYKLNVHVYRAHVSRAITAKVKEIYANLEVRGVLKSFCQAILRSYNFASVVYRVQNLFTLLLEKYNTSDVKAARESISARTPLTFELENQNAWMEFDLTNADGSTVYRNTAFGLFFHFLKDQCVVGNSEHDLGENNYYSKKFSKYLLRTVLPYIPLISHVVFGVNNDIRDKDHQAAVENWNRIIKLDEHGQGGPDKIWRYIAASKDMVMGRCNEFEKYTFMFYNVPVRRNVCRSKKSTRKSVKPKEQTTYFQQNSEENREEWRRRGRQVAFSHDEDTEFKSLLFIPWGHHAKDKCNFKFTNTCTIDNNLTIMTVMYQHFSKFRSYINEGHTPITLAIKKVVKNITKQRFNEAKRQGIPCYSYISLCGYVMVEKYLQ
ncbi:unnamed protein product [Allacma fusca]|uniref:Uncharacterized protein n=1 Tax=Allacma fusca TaxID=39272 RepID=A0A8J2PFG5_9HEXA|nr:unnamed protein product [Allacma fusca]